MGAAREPHQKMTVYDHIRELQARLFVSGIALAVMGIITFVFYQPILTLLSSPLDAPLYYNNPAGGFNFIMKVCFTGALILAMPVLIYNIIMFISPAFKKHLPVNKVFRTAGTSTLLAIAGAAFAFFCILPGTLHFLKEFQVSGLSALITADAYLKFVTNIIITFVIVFQIPLVITFFDTIKPIDIKKLLKMEKWVIVGSLIIALITPITYDPITSLLLAVPIIVLYNLSIATIIIRHSIIRYRLKISEEKTITDTENQTDTSIMVDDQTIAVFASELENIGKTKPVTNHLPNLAKQMDITTNKIHPQPVEPADWVREKQIKRMALNRSVRVFSDIRPAPRINRSVSF